MAQVIMDHGVSWCFGTSLASKRNADMPHRGGYTSEEQVGDIIT